MNLAHWWYYPDSYDEWLPAADVEGEAEPPSCPARWRLHARFLRDSAEFNEWMNEVSASLKLLSVSDQCQWRLFHWLVRVGS